MHCFQIQGMVKDAWNTTLDDNGTTNSFVKAIENLQQDVSSKENV